MTERTVFTLRGMGWFEIGLERAGLLQSVRGLHRKHILE